MKRVNSVIVIEKFCEMMKQFEEKKEIEILFGEFRILGVIRKPITELYFQFDKEKEEWEKLDYDIGEDIYLDLVLSPNTYILSQKLD